MSGNDQPPTTPENSGPEPDDEPTPVEPTPDEPAPDEPGFVTEPPPPGESDAPAAGKQNGLIIGVAAAVALLLIVGGFVIWKVVGDDDDDKKEETSISDFCDVIEEMDESEDTAEDPTIVSDALRDAGTPEDMTDDEKDGRELLIDIGDDAEDGPAAEQAVQELDAADQAKLKAFIDYIGKVCADPAPTDAPS
jgi:hypothetical protein